MTAAFILNELLSMANPEKATFLQRSRLYELVASDNLWEQRIAMVSTITFIRNREFTDTFALAERQYFLKKKS